MSLSPKLISSVAVVSFSLMTGTTLHSSSFASVRRAFTYCSRADDVEERQQHLRGLHAVLGQQLRVDVVERSLADRRRGLQLLHRARAHGHSHQAHAERDRTRRDQRRRCRRCDPARRPAGRPPRSTSRAHVAALVRDERGPQLHDRQWPSLLLRDPGIERERHVADRDLLAGLEALRLELLHDRPSPSAAPRCTRGRPGSRGRGARPAARPTGPRSGTRARPCARPRSRSLGRAGRPRARRPLPPPAPPPCSRLAHASRRSCRARPPARLRSTRRGGEHDRLPSSPAGREVAAPAARATPRPPHRRPPRAAGRSCSARRRTGAPRGPRRSAASSPRTVVNASQGSDPSIGATSTRWTSRLVRSTCARNSCPSPAPSPRPRSGPGCRPARAGGRRRRRIVPSAGSSVVNG